jgi:DNA-binding FadR family transcriptional regulator
VSGTTYALAIAILIENFKRDQMAVKEIVLSRQVTGLSRQSQRNAIKSLVKLHLIKVRRGIGKAVRVSELYL